jgi:hypothetical protein
MAEVTLRLRVNPETGRREIVVDYTTDSDALPIEHEEEHRLLAGKVVEGGLNGGKVTVTRESGGGGDGGQTAEQPVAQPTATKQR